MEDYQLTEDSTSENSDCAKETYDFENNSGKLVRLQENYNVQLEQINGQRKLKPQNMKDCPAPEEEGCEIFIGKLPRDVVEDEIYPLFSQIGPIFEVRLMMDFSGSNRGYAFIMYLSPSIAQRAVQKLDRYEIRPGRPIGVVQSFNNCRLLINNVPPEISAFRAARIVFDAVHNVKKVSLYQDFSNQSRYVIIFFKTHRDAAMARRYLVPHCGKLFHNKKNVGIDWALPEFEPSNVIEEIAVKDEADKIKVTKVMIPDRKRKDQRQYYLRQDSLEHNINSYLGEGSGMNQKVDYNKNTAESKHRKFCFRKHNRRNGIKHHKDQEFEASKRETSIQTWKHRFFNGNSSENSFFDRGHFSIADSQKSSQTLEDNENWSKFNLFDQFTFSEPSPDSLASLHAHKNSETSFISDETVNDLTRQFGNQLDVATTRHASNCNIVRNQNPTLLPVSVHNAEPTQSSWSQQQRPSYPFPHSVNSMLQRFSVNVQNHQVYPQQAQPFSPCIGTNPGICQHQCSQLNAAGLSMPSVHPPELNWNLNNYVSNGSIQKEDSLRHFNPQMNSRPERTWKKNESPKLSSTSLFRRKHERFHKSQENVLVPKDDPPPIGARPIRGSANLNLKAVRT